MQPHRRHLQPPRSSTCYSRRRPECLTDGESSWPGEKLLYNLYQSISSLSLSLPFFSFLSFFPQWRNEWCIRMSSEFTSASPYSLQFFFWIKVVVAVRVCSSDHHIMINNIKDFLCHDEELLIHQRETRSHFHWRDQRFTALSLFAHLSDYFQQEKKRKDLSWNRRRSRFAIQVNSNPKKAPATFTFQESQDHRHLLLNSVPTSFSFKFASIQIRPTSHFQTSDGIMTDLWKLMMANASAILYPPQINVIFRTLLIGLSCYFSPSILLWFKVVYYTFTRDLRWVTIYLQWLIVSFNK